MTTTIRLAIAGAAILPLAIGLQVPEPRHETRREFRSWVPAAIEFYVVERLPALPKYRVKSFRETNANSPEMAGRFNGLAAQELPCGEYNYVLTPDGPTPGPLGSFDLYGRLLLCGSFPYWVTLQAPVGYVGDGAYFPISGRVAPMPAADSDPVWIRFQHVVDAAQIFQMKLGADGTFWIPTQPLTGNVLVMVCHGQDVLFHEVVHFSASVPDHPLEIRLPKTPPR